MPWTIGYIEHTNNEYVKHNNFSGATAVLKMDYTSTLMEKHRADVYILFAISQLMSFFIVNLST